MARADDLPLPPSLPSLLRSGPVGLFIDFDGTLVAIAEGPDAIEVPDDLSGALIALRDRLDGRLAIVSGRATGDIQRHLGTLPIAMAGSHGAACFDAAGRPMGASPRSIAAETVERWRDWARSKGVNFEEKAHGAGFHYRSAPDREDMLLRWAEETAEAHGLAVKRGKMVVELTHPGADKGAAVRQFMGDAPFAGCQPVFLGDDVTDEDGFLAVSELGGFGIAVGERASASARYHLVDVAAVHEWLELKV